MMPHIKSILALFLLGLVCCWLTRARARAQAPEHLVWRQVPLPLTLKTGHERIIRFPGPVKLGLPPSIHAAMRAQIVGKSLYLLAHEDFPKTRVIVKRENGAIYLFDLAANAHGGTVPVIITDAHADHPPADQTGQDASAQRTPSPALTYVTFTRFAARALYAPQRLLTNSIGATRIALKTRPRVDLVRHAAVAAAPLIGWHAGGLYITAVKLTNRSARPIILDPRQLRGHWRAATFQHARLLAHGNLADTSAVYLISTQPFAAALAGTTPWPR